MTKKAPDWGGRATKATTAPKSMQVTMVTSSELDDLCRKIDRFIEEQRKVNERTSEALVKVTALLQGRLNLGSEHGRH